MKAFRFPLEALLRLRRRKVERAEAELASLENRRRGALQRAGAFEQRSLDTRASIGLAGRMRGSDVRRAAASSQALQEQAAEARRAAKTLEAELAPARRAVLAARSDLEALELLRDKALRQWRLEADKQQHALAEELYLARRFRRSSSDEP
ncbi:MAG: hypothetical protein H6509_13395 [Bryobacterales bacterium]|nr:hypothetical protein [Bryobacterales bacterium]